MKSQGNGLFQTEATRVQRLRWKQALCPRGKGMVAIGLGTGTPEGWDTGRKGDRAISCGGFLAEELVI